MQNKFQFRMEEQCIKQTCKCTTLCGDFVQAHVSDLQPLQDTAPYLHVMSTDNLSITQKYASESFNILTYVKNKSYSCKTNITFVLSPQLFIFLVYEMNIKITINFSKFLPAPACHYRKPRVL